MITSTKHHYHYDNHQTNTHGHDSQHTRLVSTAVTTIESAGSGSTLPQWRTPEHGGF